MCLILVTCLSSGILTSIIIQEQKHINSLDEIFDSNLDIYGYNNSFIYFKFKYDDLDDNVRRIKPRLKFIDINGADEKAMFKNIFERKAVFISDMSFGTGKKYEHFDLNLDIGDEKKYYALMGHAINKQDTETRTLLLKL